MHDIATHRWIESSRSDGGRDVEAAGLWNKGARLIFKYFMMCEGKNFRFVWVLCGCAGKMVLSLIRY